MSPVLPPVEPEEKAKPSSIVFPRAVKERVETLARERGYSFSAAVVRMVEWALEEIDREEEVPDRPQLIPDPDEERSTTGLDLRRRVQPANVQDPDAAVRPPAPEVPVKRAKSLKK